MPVPGTYQELDVSLLVDNDKNPQEMTPEESTLLTEGMRDYGQIDPIQVVPLADGKYRIVGGHSRTRAAKTLGWKTISALVLTDKRFEERDLQDFILMRLNALRGRLNPEKFYSMYQEKVGKYGEDAMAALMGWANTDAFRKMVGNVSKSLKDAGLSKRTRQRFDQDAKNASTADDLGKILNNLLAEHGASVPQNYMVFVFGGKKHLYVSCNETVWDSVRVLAEHTSDEGKDINDVLGPILAAEAAKIPAPTRRHKTKTEKPDKVEGADFDSSDDGI